MRCPAGDIRRLVGVYLGRDNVFGGGRARVAVVLGTEVLAGGKPSGALAARAQRAALVYGEGGCEVLIPTGGVGKHPPSEARVIERVVREEGVPGDAVVLEEAAASTRESALIVADMLKGMKESRALIVTDPLHCVRAVSAFRDAGIEAFAVGAFESPMWKKQRLRTGQFLRELVAVVWYALRSGRG